MNRYQRFVLPHLGVIYYALGLASLLFTSACSRQIAYEPSGPDPQTYSKPDPTPIAAVAAIPVHYTDVTEDAGIRFVHVDGKTGKKWMPETMGSGCGFFDYDQDGDLDLFLVNGRYFDSQANEAQKPTSALYENDGQGHFEDVTERAGLNVCLYGTGCKMADYDGDGDIDLFLTSAFDGNRLYQNQGNGSFKDVTGAAGLTSPTWKDKQGKEHPYWSSSAAFFDYNNDGWQDLFICNYICWSPDTDIYTTITGVGKAFTRPDLYDGLSPLLYKNNGNGSFSNVTQDAGLWNPNAKSLGVAVEDFNDDGNLDLVVANDSQPNFLFINLGNGTFVDRGMSAGIAYDENGRARAGMGIDVGHYFNDERPVIAIGNFSHEPISVFVPEGSCFFRDVSGQTRMNRPSLLSLTFGLVSFDYDLDGWLDMAVANGHIEPDIQKVEKDVTYAQSPQLFRNLEGKAFAEMTRETGDDFAKPMVGRGLAFGDIDLDGDLDLLITACGDRPRLLRNDSASREHHWIRLQLKGRAPNTQGIGARVVLESGGQKQIRRITNGSSYLSQSEMALTFGLSQSTALDALTIQWHGGPVQQFDSTQLAALALNSIHTLMQPM